MNNFIYENPEKQGLVYNIKSQTLICVEPYKVSRLKKFVCRLIGAKPFGFARYQYQVNVGGESLPIYALYMDELGQKWMSIPVFYQGEPFGGINLITNVTPVNEIYLTKQLRYLGESSANPKKEKSRPRMFAFFDFAKQGGIDKASPLP